MSRYIDADKLKEALNSYIGETPIELYLFTATGVLQVIDEQPTADVVEVVRCRDCKYYREEGLFCTSVGSSGYGHANWYPDDHCSYGKRKETQE